MRIPEYIKDFFYFTKSERNGIYFLIILIFLAIILPKVYVLYKPNTDFDIENFEKEIQNFENSLQKIQKSSYQNRLNKYIELRYDTIKLFYFNPNVTSDESFKKLGLTNKQIKTIRNYLNSGGKFYIKDDFRKIYGIRQYQYQKLKPFILLADKITKDKEKSISFQEADTISLFYFDPNTLSSENWKKLGLTKKQINIIENYRNKGGVFYKPEDLKKIYGINDDTYNKLAPYIKIETKHSKSDKAIIQAVDINTASYEELIAINGIGNYLAKNIIWYRKKLGGYIKKEQLLEIKNFRQTSFQRIKTNITVDYSKIKKININFAEVKDLVRHPYLNYSQAKAIVNYRTQNGAYQTVNVLKEKNILDENTYEKIKIYLSVK